MPSLGIVLLDWRPLQLLKGVCEGLEDDIFAVAPIALTGLQLTHTCCEAAFGGCPISSAQD